MSKLREISVVGPAWTAKTPLWSAPVVVAYGGFDKANDPVLESPALRTLLQPSGPEATPTYVVPDAHAEKRRLAFIPPSLLAAGVEADEVRDTTINLAGGPVKLMRTGDLDPDGRYSETRLTPLGAWPNAERLHTVVNDPGRPEINAPDFRLAFGQIRGFLSKTNVKHLGLEWTADGAVLFGAFKAVLDQDGRLPVRLTPEGMRVRLEAPSPFDPKAFVEGEFQLTPEIGGGLVLKLIACGAADAADLRRGLQAITEGLRASRAPLRLAINLTATPPLAWPLEWRAGVWTWKDKAVLIRREAVAASLETEPLAGGAPATADLIGESLILRQAPEGLVLEVKTPTAADTGGAAGPDVVYGWSSTGPTRLTVSNGPALLDTAATEAAVLETWKAAQALPPRATSPRYLFLPLARGVLQIAAPGEADPASPAPAPAERARGAMAGMARLPLASRGRELNHVPAALADAARASVEVLAAAEVRCKATWSRSAHGALGLVEFETSFIDARGSAAGLVWASLSSPTPEAILPTLDSGSVALGALAISFGVKGGRGLECVFGYDASGARCALSGWRGPQPAVSLRAMLWRPHPSSPLIASADMTRTAATAARPSASRDLVPTPVRLDPGQPLSLSVRPDLAPWLPTVTGSTPADEAGLDWPWPALGAKEGPGVTLVSPTLAGVEFVPETKGGNPHASLLASLRFDLPILDELFSSLAPPVQSEAATTAGPATEDPRPTALDVAALSQFWRRASERLDLARTEADRATLRRGADAATAQVKDVFPVRLALASASSPAPGPIEIDMPGLIEPYVWQTRLAVSEGAEALPLGAIELDGKIWRGEAALAGLDQGFNIAGSTLVPGSDVLVSGFAAASLKAGGFLRDNRGLAFAARPTETGARFVWREARQQIRANEPEKVRRYVTAVEALPLGLADFWCRDLPLQASGGGDKLVWRLAETAGPDAALGPDPALWSRERLPASLYEWRFFAQGEPSWAVKLGALSFRPLRLHACELKPAGGDLTLTKLVVIGALELPSPDRPADGPIGPESLGPGRNLAALVFGQEFGEIVLKSVSPVLFSTGTAAPFTVDENQNRVEVRFAQTAKVKPQGTSPFVALFSVMAKDHRLAAIPSSGRLETRLFGADVARDGGTVALDKACALDFPAPSPVEPASGLSLDAISLRFGGEEPATISVDARIVLRSPGWRTGGQRPIRALLYQPGRWLTWIGARCPLAAGMETIDHASGVVRLTLEKGVALNGELFRGLALTDGTLKGRVVLVCGNDETKPKQPALLAGHVELNWDARSGRIDHTLWQDETGIWRSSLLVDGRWPEDGAGDDSAVGWPVGCLPDPLPRTHFDHGEPENWRLDLRLTPNGESLRHVVRPRLQRQPLDLDLLEEAPSPGSGDKYSPYLARPWRLRCIVDHRLEAGDRSLAWSSLDDVAMFDLRQLAREAREDLAVQPVGPYAFQARYIQADPDPDGVSGKDKEEVPFPGVVRRALAQGGFPPRRINRILGAMAPDKLPGALMLVGGAVTDFHPEDDPGLAITATPTWIIAWAKGGDLGPLAAIPQTDREATRTYRAAPYDLDAARAHRLHGPMAAALGLNQASAAAIDLALTSAFGPGRAPPSLVPVDQSPTYPVDPIAADPLKRPIWFRSLLALTSVWRQAATTPWRATSTLVSRVSEDTKAAEDTRSALRLRLVTRKKLDPSEAAPTPNVTLVVAGRRRTVILTAPADLARAIIGGAEGAWEIIDDQAGRGALLSLALTAVPEPLALEVAVEDPGLSSERQKVHGSWRSLALPRDQVVAPTGRSLRPRDNTLHPAQTLGWPMRPPSGLAYLSPAAGDETPQRDQSIAWAGRARALALPAIAGPARRSLDETSGPAAMAQPVYLASGRRVLFRRPALSDLFSAPDRAWTPAPARARAPLAGLVQAALSQASNSGAGAKTPHSRFGPILPPRLSIATTGLRPGVLAFERDGLLVGGSGRAFDPDNTRFGAVAHWGPMAWRQVRAPRSSALPDVGVAKGRRRTYVSDADVEPPRDPASGEPPSLAPFRLVRGAVALFRRDVAGQSRSVVFTPIEPAFGRLSPQFAGRIVLRVNDCDALAAENLTADRLKAHLQVGQDVFAFAIISQDEKGAQLDFAMTPAVAVKAAAALASASPDTSVTFVAQGGGPAGEAPSDSALVAGPPRVISLRFSRIPAGRYWLPVEEATLLFGDPAYDRELSSKTASASRRARGASPSDPPEGLFALSLDRSGYDPAATVFLAGGEIDLTANRFKTSAGDRKGRLKISVVRAQDGKLAGASEDLVIKGEAGVLAAMRLGVAHGLPLGALLTQQGQPAKLKAGDQLGFSLSLQTGLAPAEIELNAFVQVLAEPVIAPPSAVYSVITREGRALRTALHAVAPMPDQIEFPALLDDLATGNVRRRALFVWRFGARAAGPSERYATLVKIDRTGGGQLPNDEDDFLAYAQEVV